MLDPLKASDSKRFRIGTCSWKYNSWQGLVYSDKPYGPYDYLEDYAKIFNTVEVDQWFWSLFPQGTRLPDVRTVERYTASVPEDFRFSVKAPNALTLTHFYARQPKGYEAYANRPNPAFLDDGILSEFLQTLEPMRERLGPILFQFEYLNKMKMPSLRAFLDRLTGFFDRAPRDYRYAVEIRNKNYLKPAYSRFLQEAGVGCVLLDGYYMPPLEESIRALEFSPGDLTVLRLHGPDRKGIEEATQGRWDRIVQPRESGIAAAAKIVRCCQDAKAEIYVNVNNHYEGCAPLTIGRLLSLFDDP
jgi:uncharacterized protein YecE (DUF72 family)